MRIVMLSIVAAVVLTGTPVWAEIDPATAELVADVCPGDLNGDEVVNSADLALILASYGICEGCDEDLNHDGYVDETDVRILASHWGLCASDEDGITQPVRTRAEAANGPEHFEGVNPTDGVFSDQEQDGSDSLVREHRRSSAKAANGPESLERDDATDGVFSDQEQDGSDSLVREYRRSSAKAPNGPERFEGDDPTNGVFSDQEQTTCEGDLDGNGTIDSTDLAMLLTRYGRCYECEADLTGDGSVDQDDIDVLMSLWGDCAAGVFSDASPKGKSQPGGLIGG